MNILDHIKEEHESFRKLMEEIKSSEGKEKRNKFRDLYAKLHGHHEAEEHVLFPLIREKVEGDDDSTVLGMIEEHSLGNYQFSLLERTALENETWDPKFSVLEEVLEHHMDEEEEEFIPLAKKVLSKETLNEINKEFENYHEEKEKEMRKKLG